MQGNYDKVAWFYDRLSRLVYGKSIVKAQVFLLQSVPANATILIVGGGTGWVLEEITRLQPSGLKIVYVEVSAKMMAKARKRNVGNNKVSFINKPVEAAEPGMMFDVIMTAFLFDNFHQYRAVKVFAGIHTYLKNGGLWLYTDFEIIAKGSFWQHGLLKMMYRFLGPLCRIETSKLPDIKSLFKKYSYKMQSEKRFFGQFIASRCYTRQV